MNNVLHLQTTKGLEEEHAISASNEYIFELAERTRYQQHISKPNNDTPLHFKTSALNPLPISSMKNILIMYGDKGSQLKSTQGIDDWNNEYLMKQKQDLQNYYPLEPTKLNKLVQYTKPNFEKRSIQSSLMKKQSSRNDSLSTSVLTETLPKRAKSVPPNLMLLKKSKEKILTQGEPFQIRDTFLTEVDEEEETSTQEKEEYSSLEKQIYQHLIEMEWIDEHFQINGEDDANTISSKNKSSKDQLRDTMKKFGKQERVRLQFPTEEIIESTKRLEKVKRGESYIHDLHDLPSVDVLFPQIIAKQSTTTMAPTLNEQIIFKIESIMSSFNYSTQNEEEWSEFMNQSQKTKVEEEEDSMEDVLENNKTKLIDKSEMVDWLKPVFAIDQSLHHSVTHTSKMEHYLENSFVKSNKTHHSKIKAKLTNLKQTIANNFTKTKIVNQYSLLKTLDHRMISRDAFIYKSKSGLAKVSENALKHAKQWHEYGIQSHAKEDWKENIWSAAKSEFTIQNVQLYEAILLYKKLQLFLEYSQLPSDPTCISMVNIIRTFLIHNRKIMKPDVLLDAMQYAGAATTQSHECLVVFHFIVSVLDLNVHEMLDLLQKKFNYTFSREWKEFKHSRVKKKKK